MPITLRASAPAPGRRQQRHDAEDERERGHQNRAGTAASPRSAPPRPAACPASCSIFANSTIRIAFFAARPISMIRPICANTLFT